MMMLRLSLLTEGGSDAVLLAPVEWLLDRDPLVRDYTLSRVDFGQLPRPPRSLTERISRTFEVDDPDILLVHRDADQKRLAADREREVMSAAGAYGSRCVPVVPVLMTESWFLFDERALRRAAGSTSGSTPLDLPSIGRLESQSQPKEKLKDGLKAASGLSGRRLQKFDVPAAYHRLARTIDDFGPLLQVPSFARTATSLSEAVERVLAADGRAS